MNERRLAPKRRRFAFFAAITLLATSCTPPPPTEPSPEGLSPEERQLIELEAQITMHVAHDAALLFALAELRVNGPAEFERSIEETVDRNIVNLGLLLLGEGEAKIDLSEDARKQLLCHLHMIKSYRELYPFDSVFGAIESTVRSMLARLPRLPEELQPCATLLAPLDAHHAAKQAAQQAE